MYRCDNCRHVFTDPITVRTETGRVSGCPWCGMDDMTEIEVCSMCGEYYESGGLNGGICVSCLRESIDYPTGLAYLNARQHLREFLETTDGSTAKKADRQGLILGFISHEAEDRRRGVSTFLDELRDYILADYICANDFSEWLTGEEA